MKADFLKSQKIIHWIMAIIIMLDLNIAQKFGGEMDILDRLESRIDHTSVGLFITFLFLLRVFLRYKYGSPGYPDSMSRWQVISAKVGHYGLYFLMGGLIVTGLLTARYATDTSLAFKTLNLTMGNGDLQIYNVIRFFHEVFTNLIIAFIAIHIFASMYHHFIAKSPTKFSLLIHYSHF